VLELVVKPNDDVLDLSLLIAEGLNEAVAPVGRPVALNVTVCAELPAVNAAVIEEVPDVPPWVAVSDAGFADSVKEFAVTVSVTVVVCVADPVPATVIG
jgi:hypothetical protein